MEIEQLYSCKSKVFFKTEPQVKKRAKELNLNYYKCKHCNGYHLTSQITYDSIMEDR